MARRSALCLLVAVVGLAGISGCSNGGSGSDSQGKTSLEGGTFVESLDADPGNLNPLKAVKNSTNNVVSFAYDSLVGLDPRGDFVPQVAKSWKVAPSQVVFTLRDDVTCEDGSHLDAEAVAANFAWINDPANGSSYLGSGMPTTGYTVTHDNAQDTVTIRTKHPDGFLLPGSGLVPLVCPHGLNNPQTLQHETDGTGPFVLTNYVADDHITMAVRKDYRWGPGRIGSNQAGFPAKVEFRIVTNPTTAVNLFLAGQLSVVTPNVSDA